MQRRENGPIRWIAPTMFGLCLLSACSGEGPSSPADLDDALSAPVANALGEMPPLDYDPEATALPVRDPVGQTATAKAPTSQSVTFDAPTGVYTYKQLVNGSSTSPHYVRPASGGFGVYSNYNQNFGWKHDFPGWNDPAVTILGAQVRIYAYDVDSNVANGEFDRISVDGVSLDPGWLQGSNNAWTTTTFDIPVGAITNDGWMNMFIQIDVYRRGWLTTLSWSEVTITYRVGPVNHPPYAPIGTPSPAGAPSDDATLGVNVTGPTPADPDGHAVTHEYRWFLWQNGAFQDPGGQIYRNATVPASLTIPGQLWRVYVTAKDELGAISNPLILDFPAIVANSPPVAMISFTCPEPYLEGTPQVCPSGSGTIDPNDPISTLTFAWSYGDGTTFTQVGSPTTPGHTYTQDGSYAITLTVTDPKGASSTTTVQVDVGNVLPALAPLAAASVPEGGTYTGSGSFTDPGADAWTATVDYGDGGGPQPLALSGKSFALGHTYADDGVYTVTVTVTDDHGSGVAIAVVSVVNAAPAIAQMSNASLIEGGAYAGSGSFTDPGADEWVATVDYGDGSGVQPLALSGKGFSLGHGYADNGGYAVTVTVTDDDGASGEMTFHVSVANAAPVVGGFAGATIESGDVFGFSTTFSDAGVRDAPWQVAIDWGDGNDVYATSDQAAPVSGSHRYLAPGTYTVTLNVTDKDGGSASQRATVEVTRKAIAIDIKPGSAENPVNVLDKGVIPVAILTGDGFDATTVDRTTIAFGPGGAKPVHAALGHLEDSDGDGDIDLLAHFATDLTGIVNGATSACLTGVTLGGVWFSGCDAVRAFANEPKGKGK